MLLLNQAWALGNDLFALRAKLPVVNKNKTWVNVARVGEWKGHGQGAFQIDAKALASFKRNFDEQENPMMVSWEHGYVPGQPRDAAGWILDMELRANNSELWALVDFVDDAADRIRQKKYLFCSIVFRMNDKHRESGEAIGPTMHELGLTNTPFIDGLKPMQLSREYALAKGESRMKDTELVAAALKELGDEASLEQIMEYVAAKKKMEAVKSGEAAESAPADGGEEKEMSADDERKKKELAEDTAALEGDATDVEAEQAAIAGAVEGLAEAAGVDVPTLLALMEEKQEKLVALLSGASSEEGGAAEAEATIANSRAMALSARVETLESELSSLRSQTIRDSLELSIERGELVGNVEDLLPHAQKIGVDALKELTRSLGADVPTQTQYKAGANQAHKKSGTIELSSLDPGTQQVVGWLVAEGRSVDDAIAVALADKEKN